MWTKIKRQLWNWRGVLITAPSAATFVVLLRLTGVLQLLELPTLDQFFLLRRLESLDSRIVIVTIDESDLKKLNKWPIPDNVLADLIKKLKAQQPKAIGLDMYRDLQVEPGHQEFVEVMKTTPNLIGVQKVAESIDSSGVAAPPELKQLDQVGANDLPLDEDGKIRRSLLYLADKNGKNIFSFSFKLANIYLKDEGVSVEQTKDYLVKTGNVIYPLFHGNDGGYVGAEDQGYQVILNYRGTIQHFQTISINDVLENRIPKNLISDRIVLIGSTAESLKDLFYTPYSGSVMAVTTRMPGVVIHANAISQILSATLDNRPLIKTLNQEIQWLWIFCWSLIGASLRWMQRNSLGKKKAIPFLPAGSIVLAGSCLLGFSYVAFLGGWWIPVITPLLGLLVSALGVTGYIARSAGDIRKTFGRYLTDEVVANLLENPEGLKLGGERKKITILTSDLRGFTATAERLPAEEVIKIINLYLGYMADVITQYQGTIDEFMGDGILVLFGAPSTREDDASRAIACGVAMQLAMQPVNQKMQEMGLPILQMGIGINTGEVVVGNIGSEKRTKYGIVGNQVNLTYRIESYTVGGQIFVSESTLKEVGSIAQIKMQREVQPKGVQQPITIYEVSGITGKHNLFLTEEKEEECLILSQPILLQYAVLDGKDVDLTVKKGSLIKLSDKRAEVCCDSTEVVMLPKALTNLKLNLFMPDGNGQITKDVYAKVLEKPAGKDSFYIYFTNSPPEIEAQLNAIYKSIKIG